MISMVVSHSHTNCPQSSNPSQQAHTPWPAWVVEPLSTLSWFGPEPLPCMHLRFSSSGQSISQHFKRPGYTAFLYLQTAAK